MLLEGLSSDPTNQHFGFSVSAQTGLSSVPKLRVRRAALHRMPVALVPGCLCPSHHTFEGFAYLKRIWLVCGTGLLPVVPCWVAQCLLWGSQRIAKALSHFVCGS